MENKDKAPSDPTSTDETAAESNWMIGADDSTSAHFFAGDRERSLFGEFGWNLQPDRVDDGLWPPQSQTGQSGSIEPETVPAPSYRWNSQSVSSSSSEDPPEKSTVSDEKLPEIP